MKRRFLICVGLVLCTRVTVAGAQEKGNVELGLDAGAIFTWWDQTGRLVTPYGSYGPVYYVQRQIDVGIPFQRVRLGYFVTDNLEIEQGLSLRATLTRGAVESSDDDLTIAQIYHFTGAPGTTRAFVRLGSRWLFPDQIEVSGGVRTPLGKRGSFRFDAGVGRVGLFTAFVNFGWSFFGHTGPSAAE